MHSLIHLLVYLFKRPVNTKRWPNAGSMLVQRRRRWTNIEPALGQRLVFLGVHSFILSFIISFIEFYSFIFLFMHQ